MMEDAKEEKEKVMERIKETSTATLFLKISMTATSFQFLFCLHRNNFHFIHVIQVNDF